MKTLTASEHVLHSIAILFTLYLNDTPLFTLDANPADPEAPLSSVMLDEYHLLNTN